MSTATAAPRRATQTTTTELPPDANLLDEVLERTTAKLDNVASRYADAIADDTIGRLKRAIITAKGIAAIKSLLTDDVMRVILPLMNSKLGFLTDRDPNKPTSKNPNPQPYPVEVVKDCLVAALLRGVYPFGNEFNIIAGNVYVAQEGYRRKVREIPGLTDLKISIEPPFQHVGQTCVRATATWRVNGVKDELMATGGKPGMVFSINAGGGGADAIIGKGMRHTLKAIYEQATGSELLEDSEGDDAVPSTTTPIANGGASKSDQLADRLGAKTNGAADAEKVEAASGAIISNNQYLLLVDGINATGIAKLGEACAKHFGVRTLNRLPVERFEECSEWIKSQGQREPGVEEEG